MLFAAALTLSFSLLQLPDLSGHNRPLLNNGTKATVLLFVRTDCPNTNRYAPELARLQAQYGPQGASFYLIYSDRQETAEAIAAHAAAYHLNGEIRRDPEAKAAALARATVTPEAGVFNSAGELLYHGRIDDRFVSLGVSRTGGAQHHDLEDALRRVLAGRLPAVQETPAVGCALSDLR